MSYAENVVKKLMKKMLSNKKLIGNLIGQEG